MPNVIIMPSIKPYKEVAYLAEQIQNTAPNWEFIHTGYYACASVNRNIGLEAAQKYAPEYIIQVDDDIEGYFYGWADLLLDKLTDGINMVSARAMKNAVEPGVMMNHIPDLSKKVQIVHNAVPSMCICFRNDGLRFDNRFNINNLGASYEDLDFSFQLNQKYRNDVYLIHNGVKLIHSNEQKYQSSYTQYFHLLFKEKWGLK